MITLQHKSAEKTKHKHSQPQKVNPKKSTTHGLQLALIVFVVILLLLVVVVAQVFVVLCVGFIIPRFVT